VHRPYPVRKTPAVGISAGDRGSTVDKQTDPFGALTDQAEGFDVPGMTWAITCRRSWPG